MKLFTGKDYPRLCKECQAAISAMVTVLREGGPDVGDEETPLMMAGDRGLMCGGNFCANHPDDEGKGPWRVHAATDAAFLWEEERPTRDEAMARAESAAREKAAEIGGQAHIDREGLGWGAYPPKLQGPCYFYEVSLVG